VGKQIFKNEVKKTKQNKDTYKSFVIKVKKPNKRFRYIALFDNENNKLIRR